MRLEEHLDFSTLGWVKPQIDELLSEARQALEAYAEDPEDARLMQSCAGLLHQVLGTLRMVELYGAAELAGEMEQLTQAVLEGKVGDRDVALGALMRGLVQLPDYLDLIESGHKDISIVLLPLLNELRDARGAEALDQRVLFHPDIDRPLPPDAAGARVAYPFADLRQRVTQIRARFQVQLLAWTQGKSPNFAEMRDGMDELRAVCHSESARRLWWVAGGVLEALQQGRLDPHLASLRQQFGQIDRTIRHLQDQGEEVCGDDDARDLVRTLLFSIASAAPGPGRTDIISQCFALDRMVPSEAELEHARAAMSGRNRALLDTVAKAVREDLLRVKEGLDIFLRRDDRSPQQLAPQVEILHRVGDTLSVLGLEAPAQMIAEQRKVITAVIDGKREAAPETILDVASALLYVDASLDEHIEHLGAGVDSGEALPFSEGRKIMRALMREAGTNLARVKEALTAFIESAWSHQQLADIPKLMAEVGGALRILNLERPAELVDGIDRYIDNELIIDHRVPTVDEMDTLADAMASVEYYLEIGRDTSSSDNRILDAAQHSLERLHYWPVPDRRAAPAPAAVSGEPAPAAQAVVAEAPMAARDEPIGRGVPLAVDIPVAPAQPVGASVPGVGPGKWVEIAEEVLEPIEGAGAPVDTSFQDAAGIDEEIREVFVEEVGEEIANINVNLPAWKANPDDLDTLKNVRRSFHTLKGSGRLVGAVALGEFSWKVENMLNRVLDRTIQPDANVQDVVDAAVATLPKLHAGLQGQPVTLDPPLDAIMRVADKLAAGEPARIADLTDGYRKSVRKVRRWVPLAEHETGVAAEVPIAVSENVITSPITGLPLVDPILLDVLRTEVGQHLQGVRDYLARNARFDVGVDDDLVRSVHTLHGAVAMVGIEPLADMLAPLEVWIRRVRSADVPLDREGCDAMRDAVAVTDHVMAQFDAPMPDVPDATALTERLAALRDRWPEAVPFGAQRVLPEDVAAAVEAGLPGEDEDDGIAAVGLAAASTLPTEDDAEALAAREHADRIAAEKAEQERLAAERAEHERLAAERAEQARLATEQAETERQATEQAEAERAEQARIAAEQAEAERQAAEQAERERLAAEQAEAERAEQARLAAEQAEGERQAAEQAERERIAAEQAEAERQAAERAEQERLAAEQAEAERAEQASIAAERAEQERLAAEKAEAARLAAEQAEAERIAAARKVAAREIAASALPAFPDDLQPDGPIDIPGLDPELVGLFTEEGNELLDSSDSLVATLRNAPGDVESVRGLQRNLHTLKGGARVVGIAAIGDLAHAMETLLEKVGDRKRELAPIEVDSLERAFDRLHDMLERVEQGRAIAPPGNAIERFNALAEGRPMGDASRPVPAEPAPVGPVQGARPAPVPRPAPQVEETEARAAAELIRVRSDLLDSLVNAAGEASIYRARLEQQVGNFRFNLVELNQTVARLREQLRKLEIETETQILSRYQRENEAGDGAAFDPLELDRFSNLQQYSRALAESVSDLASIQDILDDQARQSETLLLQQSRVNSDLQDGLMRTRMVPFESLVPNLRRTLRGAADELGKRAQLKVLGAQGEMDRNVLERMKAPFEHMLRNALAHGIEDPAQRVAIGKPMEGTVTIQVGRQGTEVLVRVSDDGAGFDRDAIRAKAIERGLLQPDVPVADSELFNFVLQTGFSTAGEVSQIAGRGVGMDVVANEIRQLGGSLAIESERGHGTIFNIRLPFTLAVTQAITVRAGDTTFAVPMTSVQAVSRIPRDMMAARMAGDRRVGYAGDEYQLHELSELLGLPPSHAIEDSTGQLPLLMVRAGDLRAAIHIDSVIGSREIVVKPVSPQISNVPGMFGATIMGDGSVMLILDPAPLVRHVVARQVALASGVEVEEQVTIGPAAPVVAMPRGEEGGPRLVMVVDDSITMRKVTTRVLEREQLEVVTAKDGVDALEQLQERVPDVMLLDIEMPRMDGYELATHMKNDARFRYVPIIMITSRTGEKHRQRAFEIGVERYLGKPYSEADLLRNVHDMLEARHA